MQARYWTQASRQQRTCNPPVVLLGCSGMYQTGRSCRTPHVVPHPAHPQEPFQFCTSTAMCQMRVFDNCWCSTQHTWLPSKTLQAALVHSEGLLFSNSLGWLSEKKCHTAFLRSNLITFVCIMLKSANMLHFHDYQPVSRRRTLALQTARNMHKLCLTSFNVISGMKWNTAVATGIHLQSTTSQQGITSARIWPHN